MRKFREILTGGDKGFTLIELLVVIAVLGILAAIAIPRLGGVTNQARVSEASAIIGSFRTAQEVYYVSHDEEYSSTLSELEAYVTEYDTADWTVTVNTNTDNSEFSLLVTNDNDSNLQAYYASGDDSVETSINGGLSLKSF